MQRNRTAEQVAWAAGLFEGEGYMTGGRPPSRPNRVQVVVGLAMKDRDIVERFAAVAGCGSISERPPAKENWSLIFDWRVSEAEKVRDVVSLLLPFMGERRRAKADEVLRLCAEIRPHNEKKTRCPAGHELAGSNLVLEPFTKNGVAYTARRCKACRRRQALARETRRRAASTKSLAMPRDPMEETTHG